MSASATPVALSDGAFFRRLIMACRVRGLGDGERPTLAGAKSLRSLGYSPEFIADLALDRKIANA